MTHDTGAIRHDTNTGVIRHDTQHKCYKTQYMTHNTGAIRHDM